MTYIGSEPNEEGAAGKRATCDRSLESCFRRTATPEFIHRFFFVLDSVAAGNGKSSSTSGGGALKETT